MTIGDPTEPADEDVSDLPGIDLQSKRRRSRHRVWRDRLTDQTVVKTLEDVRSYRAFERSLIGSVDPRSVIELALVHRLEPVVATSACQRDRNLDLWIREYCFRRASKR
jgi:hypothetical protein